ncbi:methyltransferase domain-containing protein [Modestobacter marinus]|uniref:Methyltransferase n=1 Tax=Modestobacter marinus TaxID=477641 RepID=A0A846LEG5_9ACTN|nr:methyltransferase [Modestobacter marinus]NIH65591.1 phospholipid N-methyltransferase [Modestobacter marinus]GGL65610.1 methyltransferase [Modestobacter marinus]
MILQPCTASGSALPSGTRVFLREFARAPLRTASVVPSSPALARRMIAPLLGGRVAPVVVELGPGTGSFTAALRAAAPGMRYLGVELNPVMADHLVARFPGVDLLRGPAAELPRALAERGLPAADLVVSGLPWQAFAGPVGSELVATIAAHLAPSGAYTQFTYRWSRWAPPGRRQHRELRRHFGRVDLSPTVWANLPPAVVYTATEPVRPDAPPRPGGEPPERRPAALATSPMTSSSHR